MLDLNSHHEPPAPTFFENARTYFKPAEGWVSPRTVRLINTRASTDQSEAGLAHLWPIRGKYGGCCCACRPCLPSARSIVPSKWKYPLEGLKAEYCTTLGGHELSLSLLQYYNSHGNFLFLFNQTLSSEGCSCSAMPLTWCQVAKNCFKLELCYIVYFAVLPPCAVGLRSYHNHRSEHPPFLIGENMKYVIQIKVPWLQLFIRTWNMKLSLNVKMLAQKWKLPPITSLSCIIRMRSKLHRLISQQR